MSSKTSIIAFNKPFYSTVLEELREKYPETEFVTITSKAELEVEKLRILDPEFVFFVHWSSLIPKVIYEEFNCIIFHMTDLPYGRGGSPLQNLIARGIYETKISAIKCVEKLDAGPIYLKNPLSLYGNAEEIYMRASTIISEMIMYIIKNKPIPIEQVGEVVEFTRRKRFESDLSELKDLQTVFDHIRMLDAEGYPKGYIEIGNFILEFDRASLKINEIHADVRIKLRNEEAQ